MKTEERGRIETGRRLLLLLLLLLLLSGCEGGVTNFLSGPDAEEEETYTSDKIYLPMEKVRSLNPLLSLDEDAFHISKLIYDGLFELNDTLAAQPVLAESWDYDEAGSSVTIQLKRNICWQDETPLTAADVKFSIDGYLAGPGRHLYGSDTSNISAARADGDHTVTISFKSGDNIGPEHLTFPIIPKHLWKNYADMVRNDSNFLPVGTGRYVVDSYDPWSQLTLRGNPFWHGGEPPANTLIFQVLPTRSDALNMLDVNAISFAVSRDGDRDTIYRNPQVSATSIVANEMVWLGFNFSRELMQNKKFRQGIASAIRTESILESCYHRSGILNDTIYYPGFLGVGAREDAWPYDRETAADLIRESGYTDLDDDDIIENAAGEDIVLTLLVNAENQSRAAAAEVIRESLQEAGILCFVDIQPWDNYQRSLSSGNYDLVIGGSQINAAWDMRFLLHSAWNNPIGYGNPELDVLLDAMAASKNQEERQSMYSSIHPLLTEEIPYYCLLFKTWGGVASPALQGDIAPVFHHVYRSCDTWYCEYAVPKEEPEEMPSEGTDAAGDS